MARSDHDDKHHSDCIPLTSSDPNQLVRSEYLRTEYRQRQNELPMAAYEQMMRHDSHCKVRGKIRQRGWGR